MIVLERKVSLTLYVIAFIVAAAVFSIGVFVGKIIDDRVVTGISDDVSSLSQRLMMTQLLWLLEEDNPNFCSVYVSELQEIDAQREYLGQMLTVLEEKKQIFTPETKREYFLLEAQSYLLSRKLGGMCMEEQDILVLYFYSNENCETCTEQGNTILMARDESGNKDRIKIYSFDGDLGSPVVDAFMKQYNITDYPTLVIDDNVHRGFTAKEELAEEFSDDS